MDQLRADERKLIDYHRANLAKGGLKEGNQTTTFRGVRIGLDEGTILAPSYFNGKVHTNDEDIINQAKKTGIYAMYPNDKVANDREYALHEIMKRDLAKYENAKRPPLSQLMGVKRTY